MHMPFCWFCRGSSNINHNTVQLCMSTGIRKKYDFVIIMFESVIYIYTLKLDIKQNEVYTKYMDKNDMKFVGSLDSPHELALKTIRCVNLPSLHIFTTVNSKRNVKIGYF